MYIITNNCLFIFLIDDLMLILRYVFYRSDYHFVKLRTNINQCKSVLIHLVCVFNESTLYHLVAMGQAGVDYLCSHRCVQLISIFATLGTRATKN